MSVNIYRFYFAFVFFRFSCGCSTWFFKCNFINYWKMNSMPDLPYDPKVDDFGRRILVTKTGKRITYEEASKNNDYVDKALQVPATDVPKEFTMFVLRKMAVNKKNVRDFRDALPSKAREYLKKIINPDRIVFQQVHDRCENTEAPSTFRGILTKVFCNKVIANSLNLKDHQYDKLATVFPFQVSRNVDKFEIEILNLLDDNFYIDIQRFLDENFSNVEARSICALFLQNIRHFMETTFSVETLYSRKEKVADKNYVDYLTTFPRLNKKGVEWFKFLHREMRNARQSYGFQALMFYEPNDDEYFEYLPENNFADLDSLLDCEEYFQSRKLYIHRFEKYLFFFIHALSVDRNPILFIDDMLFECLKSLRRYKTLHEDINMVEDLAKISLLHLRLQPDKGGSAGNYFISTTSLENIKKYLSKFVIPEIPQLNVRFKTDLTARMPYRTIYTCFNIRYSTEKEICKRIFFDSVLCSALCPADAPITYITDYNAFLGIEACFEMPKNIDSIRNFIRLCNKHDATGDSFERPNDHFIENLRGMLEKRRRVENENERRGKNERQRRNDQRRRNDR